jgi:hypothetical protein
MDIEGASPEREARETGASRLFWSGYTAERLDRETVLVRNPDGTGYRVNTLFQTCTCGKATENRPCAHLRGYAELLCEQQAYEDMQVAAFEGQYDPWGLTMENDRTERLLRERGVCEF